MAASLPIDTWGDRPETFDPGRIEGHPPQSPVSSVPEPSDRCSGVAVLPPCPHKCFAASLIADANVAAPPKMTVNTGFSLSIILAQTRDTGRIISGRNKNEPTKIIDSITLNNEGKSGTLKYPKLKWSTV